MNQTSVKRNDPCPCGSGKRYKHCCGVHTEAVTPTGILAQAAAFLHQDRLDEAAALLLPLTENAEPLTKAAALHWLGLVHYRMGDLDNGGQLILKAIETVPSVAEYRISLGNLMREKRAFDMAIDQYRQAIRLAPGMAEAYYNLGDTLAEVGRAEESTDLFRHAVRLKPGLAPAQVNLGFRLLVETDYAGARQHFEEALRLAPQMTSAYYGLGEALERLGDPVQGIATYLKATQIAPTEAEAHFNLGNALARVNQLDMAATSYRQALALRPNYDKAWVNAGNLFRASAQPATALAAFRAAYLSNPENVEWHFNFVQTLAEDYADKRELLDWALVERGEVHPPAPDDGGLVSFIICSIDAARLAAISANIAEVFEGVPHEIVPITNAASLCEGYNRGVRLSRGDYLVFCHDDVEILAPDFAARLKANLQDFDIVGVAGTTLLCGDTWVDAGWPYIHGAVALPPDALGCEVIVYDTRRRATPGIQALDGLFIAARREVLEKIHFDETLFDGFHFYDLDFTYRAYLEGYRLAVCNDLLVAHHSRGSFDAAWNNYAGVFRRKHAKTLAKHPVVRSASPSVRLPGRREAWVFTVALAAFEENVLSPGSAEDEARRREELQTALENAYQEWQRIQAAEEAAFFQEMTYKSAELPRQPLISLLMPVYDTPAEWLRQAIDSVLAQAYPFWELCIVDDASPHSHVREILETYRQSDERIKVAYRATNGQVSLASNDALALASGEFVALLDHDDVLERHALYRLAQTIVADQPDMIYSDEALVTGQIEDTHGFFFRPGFSPELLRAHPYIVHLAAFRTALLRDIGGFDPALTVSQDYDLILRASEKAATIVHIPEVLYRWRTHGESAGHRKQDEVMAASQTVLRTHLARCGESAEVGEGAIYNFFDIRYPLRPGQRVAIIIPSKNHGELVRQCVTSIEHSVLEIPYDILIVDHESDDPASIAVFAELGERHKVLRYSGEFNFSAINNWAVAHLDGEYSHYLLCNNDIEALMPGWLERLVELGQHDDIGVVGAKLYYPDGQTIQHAGVCVGMYGLAEHYGKFMAREVPGVGLRPGYLGSLIANHEVSAVTGACMLIRSDAYTKVGGFDEKIAVGFGDVDLCLRVREAGFRVLFCPHAELLHHESFTRGKRSDASFHDPHPADTALFLDRWKDFLKAGDPYYNPNLPLDNTSWTLKSLRMQRMEARKEKPRRIYRKGNIG